MSNRPRRIEVPPTPFSSMPARSSRSRDGRRRWVAAAAAILVGVSSVALLSGCANSNDEKARAASGAALEAPGFTRAWRADVRLTGDDTIKSLYVTDDAVHVLTTNNYAHALKRASGELEFYNAVAPAGMILRQPIVLKQTIVYPTVNTLEVYNRRGRFVKSMPFNVSFTSNGTGAGSVVYIGTDESGGRLASVDVEKPALPIRWTLMTGTVEGRPAIYQGKIFVGSLEGSVRALEDDRTTLWPTTGSKFQTSGPIVADVKADEGGVYIASTDGRLYCVDRATGRLRWQFFGGAPLKAAPALTAATVYQYVPSQGVAAVDKSKPVPLGTADNKMMEQLNRTPRWVVAGAKQFLAEDDRLTYLLGEDGSTVIAVDQKTGQEQFRSKRGDFTLWGTNTGKDGTIYAATKDGAVFAVKAVPR